MNVAAVAVRFICFEEAVKDVSISMVKGPFALGFSIPPLSLVPCPIKPHLRAFPMLELRLAKDLPSVATSIGTHRLVDYLYDLILLGIDSVSSVRPALGSVHPTA